MIPKMSREDFYNMTTTQLYKLDGKCTKLQEKINRYYNRMRVENWG
jgi:hypothetical protein